MTSVEEKNGLSQVPCHVLLNQAGALCSRSNYPITGTCGQQNFLQRYVATETGKSFPLVYLTGMLFPRHFYAEATHHSGAILGVPPLFSYSPEKHRFGFASPLDQSRLFLTNQSSSTSSDSHLTYFNYDVQCNAAMSNIDSRIISRHGFKANPLSPHGLDVRDSNMSDLGESMDSHQAALDLAGTKPFVDFDLFLTFTCNQAKHPGISHLHKWKTSRAWANSVPCYIDLLSLERKEVHRAFETAYGSIVSRCWFEVRRFWLDYITYSTSSVLKRVFHAYWRDEYLEKCGNLPHVHGLVALFKEDMENPEFRDMIFDLQKCSVLDICTTKDVERFVEEGLIDRIDGLEKLKQDASLHLNHICNERCKVRKGDGDGPENYFCKKINVRRASKDPSIHEFIPIRYKFSNEFNQLMEKLELYKPPDIGHNDGEYLHPLLQPTRHIGKVHQNATDNMSPVCAEWFAATRSMMNYQVLTGTNGVARYVVKYIVKLDEGNRCTVWADAKSGAVVKVDHQILHNTKITTSKINENKAFEKSRRRDHPTGRAIAFVECVQHLLGEAEVSTTLVFVRICTKPFEQRKTTRFVLDEAVTEDDVASILSPTEAARMSKHFPAERRHTVNQMLIYKGNGGKSAHYDNVSLFGLRPVELLEIFDGLEGYYRWFFVGKTLKDPDEIALLLDEDVTKCSWIDAVGRRVYLRKKAYAEVLKYLQNAERFSAVERDNMEEHSKGLLEYLIRKIADDTLDERFVYDDSAERDLPIPIFSSVTPHMSVPFLLHLMLVCGRFKTELDLKECETMKESLFLAKLIKGSENEDEDVHRLVKTVMDEIFPRQPISQKKLDDFVNTARALFEGVITKNSIPNNELPPCILTELLDEDEKKMKKFWQNTKKDHLDAIYQVLLDPVLAAKIPRKEEVMKCTRTCPQKWSSDPIEAFVQTEEQSRQSFDEQQLAVSIAVRSINKYTEQFGPSTKMMTKGLIIHGVAGAGKSRVISYISLVAISYGLRLMTTAILGVRANAFGGIHLHRLFCLPTKNTCNPRRLAELAIDRIRKKSNVVLLHCLLTMDVLVVDECGMLSAEQFSMIDLILRKLRRVNHPFGGVLIFGTVGHAQFSAINGLPFLLSTHLLTDFTLVGLHCSVRASGDEGLQRLQNITRKNPSLLEQNEEENFEEFSSLCKSVLSWVPSMKHPLITSKVQRMYARCKPAQEASEEYVRDLMEEFNENGIEHHLVVSHDLHHPVRTNHLDTPVTSEHIRTEMGRKMREPHKLLFFKGAMFESTVNVTGTSSSSGYSQSQLLLMVDLPSARDIQNKAPITLYACKPGVDNHDISSTIPSGEELVSNGWKRVMVTCRPESLNTVTACGYLCTRKQYALKHVGSSTITKQIGNAMYGKCAIEVTSACSPWDKQSVVVMLSRTTKGKDIIIVTDDQDFAIKKMWQCITRKNPWTDHVENLLERLSITVRTKPTEVAGIDYMKTYPFRTCDQPLPKGESGYVYILVSVKDPTRTYVGQTKNIDRRLKEHNRGFGAKGTMDASYLPYCVAGYIGKMGHVSKRGRENLEAKWKRYIKIVLERGDNSIFSRIEQGERIVQEYNDGRNPEDWLIFVRTIKKSTIGGVDANDDEDSDVNRSDSMDESSLAPGEHRDRSQIEEYGGVHQPRMDASSMVAASSRIQEWEAETKFDTLTPGDHLEAPQYHPHEIEQTHVQQAIMDSRMDNDGNTLL